MKILNSRNADLNVIDDFMMKDESMSNKNKRSWILYMQTHKEVELKINKLPPVLHTLQY